MQEQKEIERRFVLVPCSMKRLLAHCGLSFERVPIEQFYLPVSDGSERYRRIADRYVHTRKRGEGLVREEWEERVDAALYRRYKRQCGGKVIKKVVDTSRISKLGLTFCKTVTNF